MLPLSALPPDTTPFEIIEKCKPDYSILCVFGCRAYAHINRKSCKSLDSHVVPCIFLGSPEDFRGWWLWDPCSKQIIVSRDVILDENSMPGNLSAPVAPILLCELLATANQEETPKQPSVHFDNSDSNDDDPLVPLDDNPVVDAPVAPPAVPGVPPAPQCSLTPPVCSMTPETPTLGMKCEESSPHPFFGLRLPMPVRRTPTPSPFTTAGNSPFVFAELSSSTSPEPVCAPSPAPVCVPSLEPGPQRSTCATRGHAPSPNLWNATDCLRGLAYCASSVLC
jgi:hypothetical protein